MLKKGKTMKKLLLGAAIAFSCATIVHASAFTWDNGDGDLYVSSGNGDTATGYLVYLIDSGITSTSVAQTSIKNKDFSFLTGTGSYEADALSDAGWVEGSGLSGFTPGETYSFYLLVFDAGTATAAKNFYISDIADVAFKNSGVAGSASFDLSATATATTWAATSAVPEPTSGLLVLLGMAGLALRRRRA